jgi:hypothetical protein
MTIVTFGKRAVLREVLGFCPALNEYYTEDGHSIFAGSAKEAEQYAAERGLVYNVTYTDWEGVEHDSHTFSSRERADKWAEYLRFLHDVDEVRTYQGIDRSMLVATMQSKWARS